jgi:hypothetical protein
VTTEVVLPQEVPRLKLAAGMLLAALVPVMVGGLAVVPASAFALLVVHVALVTAAAACAFAVLSHPTRPVYRRVAFLASVPVTTVLVLAVLLSTFGGQSTSLAGYVVYVLLVVITGAAVWSTYVLWPVVQLDSGTSSGNRPQALSGSAPSSPSN